MKLRLIAAAVVAIVVCSEARAFELARGGKPSATIVVAEKAPGPERLAASELQALIAKSTGARLSIAAKMPGGARPVVLVGEKAVREAGGKFVAAAQLDQLRDDGYAIVTLDNPSALLLVGRMPRATLYAVYDLLEAQLGFGFFVDGDHVPRKPDAVVGSLNIVANPVFADRTCYVPLGLYGPKRFQATLWNADDWMAFLRWMAKKKFNRLAIPFTAASRAWGTAFDKAFPQAKSRRSETIPGVDPKAGVTARMGWGLSPGYTTELLRKVLSRARGELGLEATYVFVFGDFEQSLRQAMPKLKWKPTYPPSYPAAAGGSCALSASEPKIRQLQAALWKAIIETYGTDHSYVVCSTAEPRPGSASRGGERTTAVALATIRQVDPQAKAFVPTWEASLWGSTPGEQTAFINRLPNNVSLLYWNPDLGSLRRKLDTRFLSDIRGIENMMWASPQNILYTATDRLAGRPFSYAIPWGPGPGDDLFSNCFGMLANCFHHFTHFFPPPKAVGFWDWHELCRANPMMDELCGEFAWSAANVWRGEGAHTNRAVSRYLERRYTRAATFAMAEAIKQALRGAPRPETGVNYRAYTGWGNVPTGVTAAARTAVALALASKPTASDSPFYEADLVDLGRSYLHQVVQEQCSRLLAVVRDAKRAAATKGYTQQVKTESRQRLQQAADRLLKAHKTLTRLIATRKDMCLDQAIIEATATKGANKLLAQAIREHQSSLLAGGYALTDSIEYHQQVVARQLQFLIDYAKRQVANPTAEPTIAWETVFRQGADQFIQKAKPVPYDKKAEKAAPSVILQEFLQAAE